MSSEADIKRIFGARGWVGARDAFEAGEIRMAAKAFKEVVVKELAKALMAAKVRSRSDSDELEIVEQLQNDLADLKAWQPKAKVHAAEAEPNFMDDADFESHLGFDESQVPFAIRLRPEELKSADVAVDKFLEDLDDIALLRVVRDEEQLLGKFDDAGNLVVHEVAKAIQPNSIEADELLQYEPLTLVLQDSKLNCALHYLANNGVDLFGRVPFRYLLVRNRNGATPLHLLARNPKLRERVLALPQDALTLKTKRGVSVQDAANYVKHENILKEVNARVALEKRHFDIKDLLKHPTFTVADRTLKLKHKKFDDTDYYVIYEKQYKLGELYVKVDQVKTTITVDINFDFKKNTEVDGDSRSFVEIDYKCFDVATFNFAALQEFVDGVLSDASYVNLYCPLGTTARVALEDSSFDNMPREFELTVLGKKIEFKHSTTYWDKDSFAVVGKIDKYGLNIYVFNTKTVKFRIHTKCEYVELGKLAAFDVTSVQKFIDKNEYVLKNIVEGTAEARVAL